MTLGFRLKDRLGAISAMTIVALASALLVPLTASKQSAKQMGAKLPTCTQPVGKWQNERKSVLEIKTHDAATGAVSGQYTSASGLSGSYPVVGWTNSAPVKFSDSCKGCKVDHTVVFTIAVRWASSGSVSAWTGTCAVNPHSGREQISALWHTANPNSGFDWDHMLTGADRLDPIE
jgi:hypothetical protein